MIFLRPIAKFLLLFPALSLLLQFYYGLMKKPSTSLFSPSFLLGTLQLIQNELLLQWTVFSNNLNSVLDENEDPSETGGVSFVRKIITPKINFQSHLSESESHWTTQRAL